MIDPQDRRRGPAPGGTRGSARPRRRPARERADRAALHGQLRRRPTSRCRRRTASCGSGATPRSPTLGRGQTLDARPGPARSATSGTTDVDNGFRPAGPDRLSSTTAATADVFTDYGSDHPGQRHRDPPPDAVPGAERRARVRRRAPSSGRGASTATTTARAARSTPNMQQATVNLLRRHGRAARDAATRPRSRPPRRPTRPRRPRRSPRPAAGATARRRHHRHGRAAPPPTPAAASSAASRSRPTAARPGTRPPARPAGPTVGRPRQPDARDHATRAVDDSAQPRDAARRRSPSVNVALPVLDLGRERRPRATPTPTTAARRGRHEVHAPTPPATSPASASTRPPTNTGTHIGTCGPRRARCSPPATFTGESASGWQQANFASPVAIDREHHLRRVLLRALGHYSGSEGYFYGPPAQPDFSQLDSAPLHALHNTASVPNGVFSYSGEAHVPDEHLQRRELLGRRRLLADGGPVQVPGAPTECRRDRRPGVGERDVERADHGRSAHAYTVTPFIGSAAQTPTTVSGSPPATSVTVGNLTNGTSYTFKVTASNATGSGTQSAASNAVVPRSTSAPGSPTDVTATAGSRLASVSWTRAEHRWSADVLHGDARSSARPRRPRLTTSPASPPSTSTVVNGLHERHHVHVHGHGLERRR